MFLGRAPSGNGLPQTGAFLPPPFVQVSESVCVWESQARGCVPMWLSYTQLSGR